MTGHIFNDVNGNGVQDSGEPDLPGVSVRVTDSAGVAQTRQTDAAGNYGAGVAAGETTVSVVSSTLPAGSILTTANDTQTVMVGGEGETPAEPVGYQQRGTVSGHVFNDKNGNGIWDEGRCPPARDHSECHRQPRHHPQPR